MNSKRFWGTVMAACLTVSLLAQQHKSVIPYKLVGQKMIIEMLVNGQPRPYVFDTGGRNALTTEACQALGLSATDSMKVTDANNAVSYCKTTRIKTLATPDRVFGFTNAPVLILDRIPGWECFEADGIIGSDLLAQTIVTIDSKSQTITLTTAEKAPAVSLRKMRPFVKDGFMPLISMQVAPASNFTALFDTGCGGLLSLKKEDYEKMKGEADLKVTSEGYGEGSISVAGQAPRTSSLRVKIPLLSLGSTKFRNLTTTTGTPPYTLLGVKVLEYGKVTIDYPRRRFYFEAYEVENKIDNRTNNFDLTVKDGDLVVSTVWSSAKGKVEVGDRVIKINGKPIGKYDFCESIINGIPELKNKKRVNLTIRTDNGEKEIAYEKE